MIQINDFVVLIENIEDLEINSVGFVEKLYEDKARVFFIGKMREIEIELTKINFLDVTKTGKPYKYKICNVCHVLKEDYVDFDINQTDAKGRKTTRPACNQCRKSIDGVGLSSVERVRMTKIKPTKFFECPICKKASIPYVTANFVIDHNHETGKAREWICDSCNTGLGRFKDDINLMNAAIEYLRKYN